MTDKELIRKEIERLVTLISVEKEEYEKYEIWGEVPELRGKLAFAYDILSFINNLPTESDTKEKEDEVSKEFEERFISMVDATHDNNGSYSLHTFAQRLWNLARET